MSCDFHVGVYALTGCRTSSAIEPHLLSGCAYRWSWQKIMCIITSVLNNEVLCISSYHSIIRSKRVNASVNVKETSYRGHGNTRS